MASKVEISEVESLIEEHREASPLFANGLITALNVLLDEPISLIDIEVDDTDKPITSDVIESTGSFTWALDQAKSKGERLIINSHKDSVLSFERNNYVITSNLRGREVLKEFPRYMIDAMNWKIYES